MAGRNRSPNIVAELKGWPDRGSLPKLSGQTLLSRKPKMRKPFLAFAQRGSGAAQVSIWNHSGNSILTKSLQLPQERLWTLHCQLNAIFSIFPIQDVSASFDHREDFSFTLGHVDLDASYRIGCECSINLFQKGFETNAFDRRHLNNVVTARKSIPL